ncbi:MAG: glycosyltransferase [Clostridiales bacterium]|nr:glycosyltransferase [Clostridiales bacterium]
MQNELISVIIPVYNVQDYLNRCLESVAGQTYKNLQIILIDDGSTDNCPEMCDKWAEKDSRITVIHKKNAGLGLARNSGLDVANGEYIAFIDSDDFIDKNAFSDMYYQAEKYKADLVMAGHFLYNTNDKTVSEVKLTDETKLLTGDDAKKISYKMIGSLPDEKAAALGQSVWKNMYSAKIIKEYGIRFFSEREFVSEDAVFHLQLVPEMQKIVLLDKSYYYYCKNGGDSLTSHFRISRFNEFKKLYLKEIDLLKCADFYTCGKIYLEFSFLGQIRFYLKQLSVCDLKCKRKIQIAKDVVNDELIQKILSEYPYKKSPLKKRIFSFLVKNKLYRICLLAAKFQSEI